MGNRLTLSMAGPGQLACRRRALALVAWAPSWRFGWSGSLYSSGVEACPPGVILGRLSPVFDPKWCSHSGVRLYASRQEVVDEGAPAGPAGGALGGEQRCGPPCPLEKMGALDGSWVVPRGDSGSQRIRWRTPAKAKGEGGTFNVRPTARPIIRPGRVLGRHSTGTWRVCEAPFPFWILCRVWRRIWRLGRQALGREKIS